MYELLLADIPNEVVATCEAIVATSILAGGYFGARKWFARWKENLRQEGAIARDHAQQEKDDLARWTRIEAKTDMVDALKTQLQEQDERNRQMIHEAVAVEITRVSKDIDTAELWKATKKNADDITNDRHATNDKLQQILMGITEIKEAAKAHEQSDTKNFGEIRDALKERAA